MRLRGCFFQKRVVDRFCRASRLKIQDNIARASFGRRRSSVVGRRRALGGAPPWRSLFHPERIISPARCAWQIHAGVCCGREVRHLPGGGHTPGRRARSEQRARAAQ